MCDIYVAKCAHPKCTEEIEMHLADYDTERGEVRVYCEKHIPKSNRKKGVLWKWITSHFAFVEPLTANAQQNAEGNHPNQCSAQPVDFSAAGVLKLTLAAYHEDPAVNLAIRLFDHGIKGEQFTKMISRTGYLKNYNRPFRDFMGSVRRHLEEREKSLESFRKLQSK